MPWWFWIITHLWVLSFGIIGSIYIHEGEWEDNNWKGIVFGVVLHIFAPIAILVGICTFLWEEVIRYQLYKLTERDYRLKRFFESRKKKKEERDQIENDFKEMEDNEDEWRIERLGIKLK